MLRETTSQSYLDMEREENSEEEQEEEEPTEHDNRRVDIVLSDMWAPWPLVDGTFKRSISNPYARLMNTSGNTFRDHVGSMV